MLILIALPMSISLYQVEILIYHLGLRYPHFLLYIRGSQNKQNFVCLKCVVLWCSNQNQTQRGDDRMVKRVNEIGVLNYSSTGGA